MSFRHNSDTGHRWQTWLQKHRDELLGCGVPQVVLEDERSWNYFLNHGYFTPSGIAEPIIDVDHMERSQAERLCLFLERTDHYPHCSTMNRLQYLLKRGRHAKTSDGEAHRTH
jgi:hypothetical protein